MIYFEVQQAQKFDLPSAVLPFSASAILLTTSTFISPIIIALFPSTFRRLGVPAPSWTLASGLAHNKDSALHVRSLDGSEPHKVQIHSPQFFHLR